MLKHLTLLFFIVPLGACASLEGGTGFKPKWQPLLSQEQQYRQFLRAQQRYEEEEASKLWRKLRAKIEMEEV